MKNKSREAKATAVVDRLPPHDIEAEQGVLGCILLSPKDCLRECVEELRAGHEVFYDLKHQTLYQTLLDMERAGTGIDLITVQAALRVNKDLENAGGLAYVSSLPDAVPSAAHLEYYLDIVLEKYLLRKMVRMCAGMISRVYDYEGQVDDLLDGFERDVMALNRERVTQPDAVWGAVISNALATLDDYQRGKGQMLGLPTGYDYLDKMCCGLKPGELVLIAGRPGTGKTSLAFNILETVAVKCGVPCGVFSLEMSAAQLGARAIFQHARADFQRYRTGFFRNEDLPELIDSGAKLCAAPVFLDDSGDSSIGMIRAKARRWVSEHGIKLLIVDYVQLVRGTRDYRERRDEIGEVSRGLKALAKELNICVLAVAQLNRDSEKDANRNRLPQLSDLRDSGDLEQDAHMVAILHSPKLTKEEQGIVDEQRDWAAHSRRVNLQICKQRDGPTGKVELLFEKACMRFSSFKRAKVTEEQQEI